MPYLDELYACPFCGEEERVEVEVASAYDRQTGEYIKGSDTFAVVCHNCEAQSGWWSSEKSAIEAWNTRK